MNSEKKYDVAIVGAGLAGLTLAIQLAGRGRSVVLYERNVFPFHKVCGEYISNESKDFLVRLGLDLDKMQLPQIRRLVVSSPGGKILRHNLELGGFGISRFTLDNKLVAIARSKGVEVFDGCKVDDISFAAETFRISSAKGTLSAKVAVGSWGKKSNLDIRLQRKRKKEQENYVGIKYHVKMDFPEDLIELHNFENGYCGISKIEEQKNCLCYLTSSDNLKRYGGDIKMMEREVLMKNPVLKKYFENAEFLFEEPLAVSNIAIGFKGAVKDHVLLAGDAAGNIAPLSGNGMSMAMRSSFMLNQLISDFLSGNCSRTELEKKYERIFRSQFKKRIDLSGILQKMLKNTRLTDSTISMLKRVPFLRNAVVRSTHGRPF